MRRKDYQINYKSYNKKRKRMFYTPREVKGSHKKKIAFIILLVAILAGIGTTFILMYGDVRESKRQQLVKNPILNAEVPEINQFKEAGPYGMWLPESKTKDIVEPVEDQQVWMANFIDNRTPKKVKGIYVTAAMANNHMDELIQLVDSSELNTMVIDIKDDDGRITYMMDNKAAKEIDAPRSYINDLEALIKKAKAKNIYLIARIVTFKDPVLAEAKPELALWNKDGTIFRDKDKLAWVNPYKHEVWEYLVSVAKQCAQEGFDEVNFDYIRFSTDSGMANVDFGEESLTKTKIETVTEFVKYACEQLKPEGIFVSADVYGAIISSAVDAKIVGQSYVEMSKYLDYICPMIYPSHYGDGYYGIDYPDTQPYELIMGALESSREALNQIPEGEHRAIVRPWLQDFTASWLRHYIKYGPAEVREQIEAVYDSNYEEWLLWNGANNYTKEALYTEEVAAEKYHNRPTPTPIPTPTPEPLPTRTPNSGEFYDSPWKKSDGN